MLQKQRKVYEDLTVEFSKEQAEKVEKELCECQNIIKILEEELAAKTPAIDIHLQTTFSNIKTMTGESLCTYMYRYTSELGVKLLVSLSLFFRGATIRGFPVFPS